MVNHGDEVVDSVYLDNIGSILLERYDPEKYDLHVSLGYNKVTEGDLILTTSTESFGVVIISPSDIKLIKEDIERIEDNPEEADVGPDIMCRFCAGDDNGSLVSCLYTVSHLTCIGELLDGSQELLERNKDVLTSTEI